MSPRRLEGKVAIVTGAASGFGKAIAKRFAEEGCHLLITDVNEAGLQSAASELNEAASPDPTKSSILARQQDVTSSTAWSAITELAVSTFGRIDILVNNAGTSYRNKATAQVTLADFDRVFDVNVRSIFLATQAVVPVMQGQVPKGGSIINVSSIGSVRPRPGLVWYNASKGAVTSASKGLAAEYGADNIRVNALAPLLCGTGLFEHFAGVPDTADNRSKFVGNVPLGRLTEVVDVANAALYLASDEAAFLTGLNLEIDGGRAI